MFLILALCLYMENIENNFHLFAKVTLYLWIRNQHIMKKIRIMTDHLHNYVESVIQKQWYFRFNRKRDITMNPQYETLAKCLLPEHMLEWFELTNVEVKPKEKKSTRDKQPDDIPVNVIHLFFWASTPAGVGWWNMQIIWQIVSFR